MATWKKVVVSGSDASLHTVTASAGINAVLPNITQPNFVAYNSTSGEFSYWSTSSFTPSLADLTEKAQGGITPFTYNGSGAATVEVSGAAALSNNTVVKWDITDGKFMNTAITETASVVTIQGDLYVQGALTASGTASFINTQNLFVADQFILLNSGSNVLRDAGIIAGNATGTTGSAWYLEAGSAGDHGTYGRWAVAYNISALATNATADEYAVTAKIATGAPSIAPTWGGTSNGEGNIWIDQNDGSIYIYS